MGGRPHPAGGRRDPAPARGQAPWGITPPRGASWRRTGGDDPLHREARLVMMTWPMRRPASAVDPALRVQLPRTCPWALPPAADRPPSPIHQDMTGDDVPETWVGGRR